MQRVRQDVHRTLPTQTALIVPVPALEPLVGEHRRRLDASAAWGVPAHITVVYPFVAPAQVDADLIRTLSGAMAPVPAFDCRFAGTRWFGAEVLWLDPDPAEPFRTLTTAVWNAFPAYPPYEGAYDDVVPHLTVGEARVGGLTALRAVDETLQAGLPVTARIDRVLLIAGTQAPDSWQALHTFTLAASSAAPRPRRGRQKNSSRRR